MGRSRIISRVGLPSQSTLTIRNTKEWNEYVDEEDT